MLRVPIHEVARPRFPVVDMHNHLGSTFGGAWATRPPDELIAILDASAVETIVDLDGSFGDALSSEIGRWQEPYPDRVVVFAGPDYDAWRSDSDFGETEARRLRDSAARGARGLKIWKLLGLRARDAKGDLVTVDDARLDPLWSAAAELRLPVLIHIADPIAFFEPLDATNERLEELHAHPDWHFWPPLSTGGMEDPGFPRYDELIDAFERLIGRHSRTTFIGAHVASAAEDLGRVGRMLDAHANLSIDLAARIGELGRQPHAARAFFIEHAARIVFGLDNPPDPAHYAIHYRFLETMDDSFDYGLDPVPGQGRWQIHGLGLPEDILRKVYRDNARQLLRST